MDVELQATCSALGYMEDKKYIKEPDCLETVKDLIRFLRRDSDICDIRRQLGHAKIVQKDIIPLVKYYNKDKTLFETITKLLVNLTQPVITCWNNELPDEKTLRNYCIEVEGYLQDYKEAFIDEDFFNVLCEKIMDILKMNWDEMREEDKLQLERLFVLIRNILMIPADPAREQRTEDDASTHDQILWTMHTSGVEDLILFIASSERERNMLCMHILEIISLMFKEQEAEALASAGVQRSTTEKEKDQKELEQAREKERAQKKANILKFSARHSRFGGTYVIKNMKSISESDVIYHKSIAEAKTFSYDEGKNPKKQSKNRMTIRGDDNKRRSTLSMRLVLKEFCVQFLINAYNPLMRAVKDALSRKSTQDNDETYYLWAMRYFMEFCRLHCKRVDLVGETMSMSAFHYIYTQLCTYYENIRLIKEVEVVKTWGRRTHVALKAYQELLRTLDFMSRSQDEQIRESAKVIQSNVFYMMEYRDIFVTLLKNFKESKCSRSYLRDLVESTHVFLKMLENFSKSSKLVVQKKKKKKSKKPSRARNAQTVEQPTEQQLNELWDTQISVSLTEVLQGHQELPDNMTPFDAASDVQVDDQRIDTMLRVQTFLRDNQPAEALALFRAAREVWPDRDEFGSESMNQEEELFALREVFMASLPCLQRQEEPVEEDEGPNEVVEEEREEVERCEAQFDFAGFVTDFAHPDVVKSYATLLAEFVENSDLVNHCVVKMLHRLAHDQGCVGMLFQASVFKVFCALMHGPYATLPRYKELYKFACYVIRQFTAVAQHNKKVFVDLMFWKSRNEALAITGDYDFQAKSKGKVLWSEHEEQELLILYEKYRDVQHPEMDTADLILKELTSSHTRLQILKELKRQGLITSAKDLAKKVYRKNWTEEEVDCLRGLFQEHKDSNYPISDIMKSSTLDKSRRSVIDKILELNLVDDKNQLMKKKSGRRRRKHEEDEDDEEGEMLFPPSSPTVRGQASSTDGDNSSDDDRSDHDGENDDIDESVEPLVRAASAVGDNVNTIIENGYRNQLAWIQRSLRNTAEDREEGVCVPTPIVPLTEDNEGAMEDQVFLNFLRSIGITPPAGEQEIFWRIPAEFSPGDLRKIADALDLSESGQAAGADEIKNIVGRVFPNLPSSASSSSKKNDRKKVRDSKKSKERHKKTEGRKTDNDSTRSSPSKKVKVSSPFVPKIPRLAKASDTSDSDSGLDSELEAREQQKIWQEKRGLKKSGKKFAEERREALNRMKVKQKERRDRKGKTKEDDENIKGINGKTFPEGTSTEPHEKVKSPTQNQKKISVKNKIQSDSDSPSDTSSLSSMDPDDLDPQEDLGSNSDKSSSHASKSSRKPSKSPSAPKRAKKRYLDSESDSSQPNTVSSEALDHGSTKEKKSLKRVRILASDDENDVDDFGNKENLRTGLAEESFTLHFSSSEDESKSDKEDKNTKSPAGAPGELLNKDSTGTFPATLLTQALDSEDENDHITLRTAMKRKRAILDDDD